MKSSRLVWSLLLVLVLAVAFCATGALCNVEEEAEKEQSQTAVQLPLLRHAQFALREFAEVLEVDASGSGNTTTTSSSSGSNTGL